jgi:hypothetical protein
MNGQVRSIWAGALQQRHFVVFGPSSLVVAGSAAVLVAAAPAGSGPDGAAAEEALEPGVCRMRAEAGCASGGGADQGVIAAGL